MKNDTKNATYLFIVTTKGVITVPFPSVKIADEYTTNFNDQNELISKLSKILQLDITQDDILDTYLEWQRYDARNRTIVSSKLPIKYQSDNYDINNLKVVFSSYLKEDRQRIMRFDIRYLQTPAFINFVHGNGVLTERDIDFGVEAFLKDGNYMKARDIYFGLKYSKRKVKTLPKRIGYNLSQDLDKHYTRDTYLSSLLDYAKQGDEEYAKAMEIIASYDLEQLDSLVDSKEGKIVDGLYGYADISYGDIVLLELATQLNINTLVTLANSSIRKKRNR